MLKKCGFIIFMIIFVFAGFSFVLKAEELPTPSPPIVKAEPPHQSKEEILFDITVEELMSKMEQDKKLVLLDVRTQSEYEQGHLPKAILIPHNQIENRFRELGCKCNDITVYSRNDHISKAAAETLRKSGYRKTKELVGGIEAWRKAGGKIVTEENSQKDEEEGSLPAQ
jgi:phage shock protein E